MVQKAPRPGTISDKDIEAAIQFADDFLEKTDGIIVHKMGQGAPVVTGSHRNRTQAVFDVSHSNSEMQKVG